MTPRKERQIVLRYPVPVHMGPVLFVWNWSVVSSRNQSGTRETYRESS